MYGWAKLWSVMPMTVTRAPAGHLGEEVGDAIDVLLELRCPVRAFDVYRSREVDGDDEIEVRLGGGAGMRDEQYPRNEDEQLGHGAAHGMSEHGAVKVPP